MIGIDCTRCNGLWSEDCPTCKGTGALWLDQCPQTIPGPSIVALFKGRDRLNKGLPPISGGWLEQSETFMDAVDLIEREENT